MKIKNATGSNNRDLIKMNQSAVVRILQRCDVCSRAEIARQTGLTQSAITKIVAALMDLEIVDEVGSIKGSGNRRSIGLTLKADNHRVIGVKFARQMFAVGVFDIAGKTYFQREIVYSAENDPKTVLTLIREQIRGLLDSYQNVVAIGIAVPGPYLREEGRIAVMTQMPAWRDINFIEEFHDGFEVPVFIEHDANAGALAEWLFEDYVQSPHTLAYFLVGEGVGSGIIERGKLLLGAQGAASEIGHISVDVNGQRCECGNYGCLEMFCSVQALLKKALVRVPECFTPGAAPACDAVFQAAADGNQGALDIVREIGEYIGYGCVTLINAYNPDIIVIGDAISHGGDILLSAILDVVRQRVHPALFDKVQIKLSNLKVDPSLYGAAAVATDKVLQSPRAFAAVRART
ncbi:MAG: ROK family transcriptional regulator [Eubacteriales bacterium]|nr:ROK family transcriptional regulator [Eubacteriales bacterium]